MNVALRSTLMNSLMEDADFLFNTQKQIAKDFYPFSGEFTSDFDSISLTLDQIYDYVEENVTHLMEKSETTFLQLLYSIDLPEKEFLELTQLSNFISEISKKIVLREAYKIYLREKYRT